MKNSDPGKDQRALKRVQSENRFQVEFRQKGRSGNFNKGHGCDLSLSGVRFITMAPLAEGSWLEVTLHFSPYFPGFQKIVIPALVVRAQRAKGKHFREVACQFQDKDCGPQKQAIEDFILWFLSRAPEGTSHAVEYLGHREGKRTVRRVEARDEFLVEFEQEKVTSKGYGCDLSVLGASFISPAGPREGSVIQLFLSFSPRYPGLRQLHVSARVLRTERIKGKTFYEVGCEFEPKQGVRQAVNEFLDWLERNPA